MLNEKNTRTKKIIRRVNANCEEDNEANLDQPIHKNAAGFLFIYYP